MEISKKQKEEMEHCLGLDYKKKPFRNFYNTFIDDNDWNDLVKKEFATKWIPSKTGLQLTEGTCYYYLTEEGAKFLGVKLPK